MDVARRSEAQPASELRAQVADNVTEQVAGDDDIELARITNDLHCQRIDIEVPGFNLGVFLTHFFEYALPEIVGEGHGIRFIAHAKPLEFVGSSVFEGVAYDAVDAFAGIDVLLYGDFVGSVLFEEATDPHV